MRKHVMAHPAHDSSARGGTGGPAASNKFLIAYITKLYSLLKVIKSGSRNHIHVFKQTQIRFILALRKINVKIFSEDHELNAQCECGNESTLI